MKQQKESAFVISEFTNPSGEIVFRVSGWLGGKRIRKNFPTRAEARGEIDALEIEAAQAETGLRRVVTRLNEAQVSAAEAAFLRLGTASLTLSFCVDFTLANYREPVCQKSLVEAAAEYVAAKKHEFEQDLISHSYFVRLEREMERMPRRIRVSKDTAKLGLAKNTVNIVGQLLVVFHASQSPTLYDPSFIKTFRTRRGGVDVVRTYRDDSSRSDILAVDWTEDIRVTSPMCARKLTAS